MRRLGKMISVFLILLLAAGLLTMAGAVAEGVREGLTLCVNVIVPSLFPFMILSGYVALSGLGPWVALPLRPLTRKLLRLPDEAGSVYLMSLIGGYPVGARTMATLIQTGRLNPKLASRMLCYCVNAGPAFLVAAVGLGFFRSAAAGWILLAGQVSSSLLIGAFVSRQAKEEEGRFVQPPSDAGNAFVAAVGNASAAIINTCAFVVLFSGLNALLRESGLIAAAENAFPFSQLPMGLAESLLAGIMEVTGGCAAASSLAGNTAFLLTAFFVSFGGLSIMAQIASAVHGTGVDLRGFLLTRFVHGALTAAISYPLYLAFAHSIPTFCPTNAPAARVTPYAAVTSVGMLAMAAMLLLSLPPAARKE
jgi:sporulation integral membrane protein YlbJ